MLEDKLISVYSIVNQVHSSSTLKGKTDDNEENANSTFNLVIGGELDSFTRRHWKTCMRCADRDATSASEVSLMLRLIWEVDVSFSDSIKFHGLRLESASSFMRQFSRWPCRNNRLNGTKEQRSQWNKLSWPSIATPSPSRYINTVVEERNYLSEKVRIRSDSSSEFLSKPTNSSLASPRRRMTQNASMTHGHTKLLKHTRLRITCTLVPCSLYSLTSTVRRRMLAPRSAFRTFLRRL